MKVAINDKEAYMFLYDFPMSYIIVLFFFFKLFFWQEVGFPLFPMTKNARTYKKYIYIYTVK